MLELVRPAAALDASTPAVDDLKALIAGFLSSYENEATRSAYAGDLRAWLAWCADVGLHPLGARRPHLQLYARQLEELGRAPGTVGRRLSVLAGFYRYAVEERAIPESPAATVRRPKVPEESPTLGLDLDEIRAVLAAAERAGRLEHALICLLALNGLRVSEACQAQLQHLDEVRGHQVLTVTRKGGRRAGVPLARRTAAAVAAVAGDRTTGPVLVTAQGRQLTRQRAWELVRQLARAAGVTKRIHPHSLRHSFVTAALDAGVPLRDVQDAAGHADPRTTRRYDRGRQSLDRHATYAVADFVDGGAD